MNSLLESEISDSDVSLLKVSDAESEHSDILFQVHKLCVYASDISDFSFLVVINFFMLVLLIIIIISHYYLLLY